MTHPSRSFCIFIIFFKTKKIFREIDSVDQSVSTWKGTLISFTEKKCDLRNMNRGAPPSIHQCEEVERERKHKTRILYLRDVTGPNKFIFFPMWMVWQQNIFRAAQTKLFDFVQRQRDV